MSEFDVSKQIRERRLAEAAAKRREKLPPTESIVLCPLPRPSSARSSGQDFGDAESYTIHSNEEDDDDAWYRDETQEDKREQNM